MSLKLDNLKRKSQNKAKQQQQKKAVVFVILRNSKVARLPKQTNKTTISKGEHCPVYTEIHETQQFEVQCYWIIQPNVTFQLSLRGE